MLNYLSKTLLTGLATLLPIVLTVYLLYWVAVTFESSLGYLINLVLPEKYYFPGMGTLTGVIILFIFGLLMKAYLIRRLFTFGEDILYRMPLIKSIYRSFREFFDFFASKNQNLGQVVAEKVNGMEQIGFITQDDSGKLPASFQGRDYVVVYLPMSYMIGGVTMFVPGKDLRPLDMSKDEAMKYVLTAGITGQRSTG